jgi:LysR family nitrogen assimilation transcriptional regulator
MALPDLESLRYFVAVVQAGSISSAARSLNLAQPALTKRIQQLEELYSAPLLRRRSRGVELTEIGEVVHERAQQMLRMCSDLMLTVRSRLGQPAGPVRFGFPPSIAAIITNPVLSAARGTLPFIQLNLREEFSPGIRDALLGDRLDIGVMSCTMEHPLLTCRPLFMEPLWLFGGAADWPFGDTAVTQARIRNIPIMVAGHLRRMLGPAFQSPVAAEVESLVLAKQRLLCEGGLFMAPHSSLRQEVREGSIRGVPVGGLFVSRGCFYRSDHPMTPEKTAIVGLILDEADRLVRSGGAYEQVAERRYIV